MADTAREHGPKQMSFTSPSRKDFVLPESSADSPNQVNKPLILGEGHCVDLEPPKAAPLGQVYRDNEGNTFIVRNVQYPNGETGRAGVRELPPDERSAY